MTFEEYDSQKERLTAELENLKNKFIHSNMSIPLNTKVMVTQDKNKPAVVGIVTGGEIYWNGVRLKVHRIKKDGTLSSNVINIYTDTKIEVVSD